MRRRPRSARTRASLARLAALALLAWAGTAVPAAAAASGEFVVGARSPAAAAEIADELRAAGLEVRILARIDALAARGERAGALTAALRDDPRVDFVEPARERSLSIFVTGDPGEQLDQVTSRTFTWALDAIGAPDPSSAPGRVSVAVVDSGIDSSHPDLAGRVGPAISVVDGPSGSKDPVGHGTFVAGLISGIRGNGIGGYGIAGDTVVIPVRVTSTGSITSTDSALGITKAADSGARVMNLSYGGDALSEAERAALAYAASRDVLVVAAAGNNYQADNRSQYPAAAVGGYRGGWGTGLSVGATGPVGLPARFSTSNDYVSIAAPGAGSGQCGDGVFSTIPATFASLWDGPLRTCSRVVGELGDPLGRYGYAEGTSFATPLVAGAAALVRGVNPALSAEQTADVLRRSAHQTQGSGWNLRTGAGVLDVPAALALARIYDTVAPSPALGLTPSAGGVLVAVGGRDEGAPGGQPAGIATYRLERSADGGAYTEVVSPQATPIRLEEPLAAGEGRWYRGTVCDATRNCATTSATTRGVSGARTLSSVTGLKVRSLSVGRPKRCRTCLQVRFTVAGAPARWALALTSRKAGVDPLKRSGSVAGTRPVTLSLPLSPAPKCGGRLVVTLRLTQGALTRTAVRSVAVGGRCARARQRR